MHDLDPQRIQALLGTRRLGRSLDLRAETASTNDDAREAARGGAPAGHVVVADAQSRGRGAHGRVWSSPSGTDLYLSIVERLAVPLDRVAPLTLAVGLAVAETVAELAPELAARVEVKWPNDVWIARRKTAGILIEASSMGARLDALVIGIGLGVNRLGWDDELQSSATSVLASRLGSDTNAAPIDRALALATLLGRVEAWIDRFVAEGAIPVVRALAPRLAMRGEQVRCDDVIGVLEGVEPSGALRLGTSDGPRTVLAGTLRPV